MPRLFHLSLDTAVHFQSNRQSNFSGVLPPTSKKLLTLQLHALRSSSAEDGSIEGSFWRREAHVEDLPLRHSSTPNHAARTHMPIGSPTSKRNRTAPSTPPASSGVEPMRLIAAYPAEDTATNAQVQSQRKLRSSRLSDTALSWSGKDVKDLMQRLKAHASMQAYRSHECAEAMGVPASIGKITDKLNRQTDGYPGRRTPNQESSGHLAQS